MRNPMPHPSEKKHTITLFTALLLAPIAGLTAAFGKWDMAGHTQTDFDPVFMPNKQGFNYFFGIPSSNNRNVNLLRNDKMIEKNANRHQAAHALRFRCGYRRFQPNRKECTIL